MMTTIEMVKAIPSAIEEKMEKELVEQEKGFNILVNYKKFAFILKEENEIIGVLRGFHSFSAIHIDDLWIDSRYRNKGHGRKLLQALEKEFANKGFNNINLITCDFQAPEFYEKCGYLKEFTRVNKENPLLTNHFYVKFF